MNRRVDTHAHIFEQALRTVPGARRAPQYDASLAAYTTLLDEHEIAFGVLTAPSFLGTDNSFLLKGLAAAGGRMRGTVIVEPRASRAYLQELAAAHVRGIRLNFFGRPEVEVPDLGSAEYRGIFERCAEIGWHVEIYGEGMRLAKWLPLIARTGVNIVVDHFGSPDPALGVDCPGFRYILDAFESERMWVKLSGPYRFGHDLAKRCAPMLLREGGATRLLFGSDWPWTQHEAGRSYGECVGWLEQWVPQPEAREQILGETPRALFGFT